MILVPFVAYCLGSTADSMVDHGDKIVFTMQGFERAEVGA